MGIPVRIALKKDLLSLVIKENRLKRLSKQNPFHWCEAEKYPEMFSKLTNKNKEEALKIRCLVTADKRCLKREISWKILL